MNWSITTKLTEEFLKLFPGCIDSKDFIGPLMLTAVYERRFENLLGLLVAGANPNLTTNKGQNSPLQVAARLKCVPMV